MKYIITMALSVLLSAAATEAFSQSWAERLGDKMKERAKQRTEDNVLDRVDRSVDGAFNSTENAMRNSIKNNNSEDEQEAPKKKKNKKKQVEVEEDDDYEAEAAPSSGSGSSESEEKAAPKPAKKATEAAYMKSDFVAGDEIIFEDNLNGEQLGEFPSQWDLLHGSVEVAKINGENVIFATQPSDIAPLFDDMNNYLTDKFTIEFDYWIDSKNEGWHDYHIKLRDNENNQTQEVDLTVRNDNEQNISWHYSVGKEGRNGNSDYNAEIDSWQHFALSFNKRAMKIYINGIRLGNIPNTNRPSNFFIWVNGNEWENSRIAIKNVRVAKGAVPLYDRMMNDGKFITYGITFDVGKATIKPESMGEINRILNLMQEHPELKFSVEGHTDSTGKAATNQTLSEQRSQAIVAKLTELGIDGSRLKAVGKGQNSPVADNSTDEGRAKNRRVEFVTIK